MPKLKNTYCTDDISHSGEILDYVHDRVFDLNAISHDENEKILTIPLTIEIIGKSERKYLKIFHCYITKEYKAELCFHNIDRFRILDNSEIGRGMINKFLKENDEISLLCTNDVKVIMTCASFLVRLAVFDEVISMRRRYWFV